MHKFHRILENTKSPNPNLDLKFAERLRSIEDASEWKVVLFRLKGTEFLTKYGNQLTIEATLSSHNQTQT